MHALQQWHGSCLPDLLTHLRSAAADLLLDRIECGCAIDGFGCDRRWMCHMDLVELVCREDVLLHRFNERCQQITRSTDPSGERGAVEIEAFARVDLRLAIERLVVGVLGDQHMCEQAGTSKPAVDGA